MITNEGGKSISRNMFITNRSGHFFMSNLTVVGSISGTPKVENMYFSSQQGASSEQHHPQYTRTSCWRCAGPLDTALVDKARNTLCTLTVPCRIFLSLRRRHVSDRAFADGPRRVLQLLLLVLRQRTMGTNLPHAVPMWYIEKRRPCNLMTCVYGRLRFLVMFFLSREIPCKRAGLKRQAEGRTR